MRTKYDAKASMDDGFLNFTSNDTQVFKVFYREEFLFLHGRWAVESVSLKNDTAHNKTYSKTDKHKVFIIE